MPEENVFEFCKNSCHGNYAITKKSVSPFEITSSVKLHLQVQMSK